jgi:virginiamycin B lyase
MLTYRRPSALRLVAVVFALVVGLAIALGAMLSAAQAAPSLFKFTQYKVPTANSEPRYVTPGSDGNLWFTEGADFFTPNADPDTGGTFHNQIGRITPTGEITEFRVEGCQCFLNDIVQGPGGVLYYTTNNQGLGRITTDGEVLPEVVPGNFSAIGGGVAAHGNDVWYTDFNTDSLWRYSVDPENPNSGQFTQFEVPTPGADPLDVAVASDGTVWFSGSGAIRSLDPQSGAFTETPVTGSSPRHIAIASDGKVWFTDRFNHNVGYLDPSSDVVEVFPTLTPNAGPQDIAAANDGSMWFTQARVGNVARITPDGVITEEGKAVKDDPNSGQESAFGITVFPENQSVWYTLPADNKIASLRPR